MTVGEAANLLGQETSPYLLQHAANPVHWRPWGASALAEAAARNRPILLSVGYAACHWCHVMAHESFEDAETAALINALFVPVKVDREERPDIDHLYMTALQAMGEQGGWPLTMFLTPQGEPFWGGTYFPPTPRWGRPSFRQVLRAIAEAWRADRGWIAQNTAAIGHALAATSAAEPGPGFGPDVLDRAARHFLALTDPVHGGLAGAPRFPNAPIFRFLWQDSFRAGRGEGIAATRLMLERMAAGGIHDHLGGGFARYSTDAEWLVPHFEKMLYDNALLLDLLALAHATLPDPGLAEAAEGIVSWLDQVMTAAPDEAGNAAFAAAEDADSEGEEGKFYVWTAAEISSALGEEAGFFARFYEVAEGGNWEGKIILRRIAPRAEAKEEKRLARCRETLAGLRARRVRPLRDDKVLADWNGLAIAALARAAAVFGRPAWLDRARRAFAFILAAMGGKDGRIAHAWRLGRISAAGLLDDQAAMARAAIALFEATGEAEFLAEARRIVTAAEHHFAAPDGAFFLTADDAADLPQGTPRPRHAADGPAPSGNAMMAETMARLFYLTAEERWRQGAEAILSAFSGRPGTLGGSPSLLTAADTLEGASTVVITGDPASPARAALHRAALAAGDPATIVLGAVAGAPSGHPAYGKSTGRAAAFVCRAGTCSLPLASPEALAALLRPLPT